MAEKDAEGSRELAPETPDELAPDPDGQNDDRAEWAERAIEAFMSATRTDREDALCDLLADLMHWADRNGNDFDGQLDRARGHYAEETGQAPLTAACVCECHNNQPQQKGASDEE